MKRDFICIRCKKLKINQQPNRGGYCWYCKEQAIALGEMFLLPKPKCLEIKTFTEQQSNILTGLMLGDGNLDKKLKGKNATLQIHRSQEDLDYLIYQKSVFDQFITPAGICQYETDYDCNGIIKTNKQCSFRTHAHPLFTELWKKWYVNKVRQLPNDLELNREIIAHWFCDDGSIFTRSKRNKYILCSSFSTNNFSKEEVIYLREKLIDRYNEYFSIGKINKPTKNYPYQYFIAASNDATREMLKDIDPIIDGFMGRKSNVWRNSEARFYENQPHRTKRYKDYITFIMSHNTFTISDMAKELNMYEARKLRSGNITVRPSLDGALKYINMYLSKSYLIRYLDTDNRTYIYELTALGKEEIKYDPRSKK